MCQSGTKILSKDLEQCRINFCKDVQKKIKDDSDIFNRSSKEMKHGASSAILKRSHRACSGKFRRYECQNQRAKSC